MSTALVQIFSRILFAAFIAMSYLLYRRLTRKGAVYSDPTSRKIYATLAIILTAPWLLSLVLGPAAPRYLPRFLATIIYLPAICFVFTQISIGLVLAVSWPFRRNPSSKEPGVESASTPLERAQSPAEVLPPKPERRLFLKRAALIAPIAPFALTGVGVMQSQMKPAVRRVRIALPNLPRPFEGFTIAQLSDIHVGPYISFDVLKQYVALTNKLKPDLIALTGDLVNHEPELYPDTARILSTLKAPFGKYACLGNHEYYLGVEAALDSLPRYGVPLLRDSARRLKRQGEELSLIGLDYSFRFSRSGRQASEPQDHVDAALKHANRDAPVTIALTHHPHDFDSLAKSGADLTLAGHTHGGQLALGPYNLGGAFFRYSRGHYQQDGRHLFVSSGMGHWLPFRLGCPTEIILLTLVRA